MSQLQKGRSRHSSFAYFACSTVVAKKCIGCCASVIVMPRGTSAPGPYYLFYPRNIQKSWLRELPLSLLVGTGGA